MSTVAVLSEYCTSTKRILDKYCTSLSPRLHLCASSSTHWSPDHMCDASGQWIPLPFAALSVQHTIENCNTASIAFALQCTRRTMQVCRVP